MPVTVLLVGNSRLHWGRGEAGTFQLMERWDGHWPPWSVHPGRLRWARVGRLPEPLQVVSNTWPAPISTPQVPLLDCPAAVGVDRALATWAAWQQSNTSTGTGTMVVDAGTALTITVVDRKGSVSRWSHRTWYHPAVAESASAYSLTSPGAARYPHPIHTDRGIGAEPGDASSHGGRGDALPLRWCCQHR